MPIFRWGQSWRLFHDLEREVDRSEEHTSELQSRRNIVCSLLLEKKTTNAISYTILNNQH